MNGPIECDVIIAENPSRIGNFLVPGDSIVHTNNYAAQKYQLPESRLHLGHKLSSGEETADYHELSHIDPAIALEDFASVCSLLCIVDAKGSIGMLHAKLNAPREELSSPSADILRQFRERTNRLLGQPRKLILSGTDVFPESANIITDHIRAIFSDTQDIIMQLSGNILQNNPIPEVQKDERYSGMLFIPRQISKTAKSTLLLLTNSVDRNILNQYL